MLEDLLVEVYSAGHTLRLAAQGRTYDHQAFLGQAVVSCGGLYPAVLPVCMQEGACFVPRC